MLPHRMTGMGMSGCTEHPFLKLNDVWFSLGELLSGAGYGTPINSLILDFKIAPSRLIGSPQLRRWKRSAIDRIADALTARLQNLPPGLIVVPIPTSKLPGHVDYDDRLVRVLAQCRATPPIEVRELVRQRSSTPADHESDRRQSFGELLANCYVDEAVALPEPSGVILFDDVLTEGKHFKVCQRLIRERYGPLPVSGLFVARRVCARGGVLPRLSRRK